jgi:TnpA family transposase
MATPTALGEAIAMYGRIFKTLHILSYIDTDETCRRDIRRLKPCRAWRGTCRTAWLAGPASRV